MSSLEAATAHLEEAARLAGNGANSGSAASGQPQQAQPSSGGSQDYSPYSNPWGERPPVRSFAGNAVRMSSSDLPTPAAFTPPGGRAGSAASPGTSPPFPAVRAWHPQHQDLQQPQQPQQLQQQHQWAPTTPMAAHTPMSAGGSNSIVGGTDTPFGAGYSSPVQSRLAGEPWEGAGSSTKAPAGGLFEFQTHLGTNRAVASPDLRFAAGNARQAPGPSSGSQSPEAPNSGPAAMPTSQQHEERPASGPATPLSPQRLPGALPRQQASERTTSELGAPPNSRASDGSGGSRGSGGGSRERPGAQQSPSQLLRQAIQVVRSKAAVSGSSHIPLERKQPSLFASSVTPYGRGLSAAPATPNPTPATPLGEGSDAAKGHDQASFGTPGSKRQPVERLSPPVYRGDKSTPVPPQARSPGSDSDVENVSYGSRCDAADDTAPDTAPDVDGNTAADTAAHAVPDAEPDAATNAVQAAVPDAVPDAVPVAVPDADAAADSAPRTPPHGSPRAAPVPAATGIPQTPASTTGPMPLDQLIYALHDNMTRDNAERIFNGKALSVCSDVSGRTDVSGIDEADSLPHTGMDAQDQSQRDTSKARGTGKGTASRASRSSSTPLGRPWLHMKSAWALALVLLPVGCIAGAVVVTSQLPGWLPPVPGAVCDATNAGACQKMYKAMFQQGNDELVAGFMGQLQLGLLRAKWHVQDNWDYLVHGRMPPAPGTHVIDEQQQWEQELQEHGVPINDSQMQGEAGHGAAGATAEGASVLSPGGAAAGQEVRQHEQEEAAEAEDGRLTDKLAEDLEAAMVEVADLADQVVEAFAPQMQQEGAADEEEKGAAGGAAEAGAAEHADAQRVDSQEAGEAEAATEAEPMPKQEVSAPAEPVSEHKAAPKALPKEEPAAGTGAADAAVPQPPKGLQKLPSSCPAWLGLTDLATCFPDCSPLGHMQRGLLPTAGHEAFNGDGICYAVSLSPLAVCGDARPLFGAHRQAAPVVEEPVAEPVAEPVVAPKTSMSSSIYKALQYVALLAVAVGVGAAAVANADTLTQLSHSAIAAAKQAVAALRATAAGVEQEQGEHQQQEQRQVQQEQQQRLPEADELLLSGDEQEGGARAAPSRSARAGLRSRIMSPKIKAPAPVCVAEGGEEGAPSRPRRRSAAAAPAPAAPRRRGSQVQAEADAAAGDDEGEVVSPRAGRGRRSTAGRLSVLAEERAAAAEVAAPAADEAAPAPTPSTATARARRAAPRRSGAAAMTQPDDGHEVEQALASPGRRSTRASRGTRG